MSRHIPDIRLRPVTEADLGMFRRFAVEPGLIGLDWSGFRDPNAVQRRFETDSYLGAADGRLIIDTGPEHAARWHGVVTPVQRIEAATVVFQCGCPAPSGPGGYAAL